MTAIRALMLAIAALLAALAAPAHAAGPDEEQAAKSLATLAQNAAILMIEAERIVTASRFASPSERGRLPDLTEEFTMLRGGCPTRQKCPFYWPFRSLTEEESSTPVRGRSSAASGDAAAAGNVRAGRPRSDHRKALALAAAQQP